MLTLAQLRTPITEDQAVQTLLDQLQALGFNVSSWQSGSVERDIVEAIGFVLADSTKSTDALSRLGYNDSATGDALTELSFGDGRRTDRTVAVALRQHARSWPAHAGDRHANGRRRDRAGVVQPWRRRRV
jgi:hypothetical protein